MKCIYCNTDNTYKDRTKRTCKKCGKAFAFEPKTMGSFVVTDPAFKAAIEAVSAQGTLSFTSRQLYYQVLRPKSKARPLNTGGCFGRGFFVVLSIALFVFLGPISGLLPTVIAALAAVGLYAATYALGKLAASRRGPARAINPKATLTYEQFRQQLLGPWMKAHGTPPKILLSSTRERQGPRRGEPAADLQSYSFERLLVCDRDETVDLLLANNFHFETNTPVVSIKGYPHDVFTNVMAMVRCNPNLVVFALHDADAEGCLLPLRLREEARWFPQPSVAIIDIGLRPRQVPTLPGLIVSPSQGRVTLPPALNRALTPGERQWLSSGYRAELAAMRPDRLMRAIYQTINRTADEVARHHAASLSDPRGFFQTRFPGMQTSRPAPEGGTTPHPAGGR